MLRSIFRIATLLCMGLVSPLWAQVGNSVLTGTIGDPSNARVPGATVTATNTQTSVETVVISNESGACNISNLPPRRYTLRASLPGFRTQTFQNIDLGGNQTERFNFTLQVAATQTTVDVTVDAQQLLTQAGGTVGDVLPEAEVRRLPLVSADSCLFRDDLHRLVVDESPIVKLSAPLDGRHVAILMHCLVVRASQSFP